jgi:DNA-directed RNA polymerase specialized sigma24 family protein
MLFAEDGQGENPDELDFDECRFNRAFRMFRIDFLRSETARTKPLEALPEEGRIEEPEVNEKRVAHLPEALRTRGMQLPNVQLAELLDAINSLPSDGPKAVMLCCVLGCKQESDDPSEKTGADLCGVTPRTIRNRLNRAAQKLSQFK